MNHQNLIFTKSCMRKRDKIFVMRISIFFIRTFKYLYKIIKSYKFFLSLKKNYETLLKIFKVKSIFCLSIPYFLLWSYFNIYINS